MKKKATSNKVDEGSQLTRTRPAGCLPFVNLHTHQSFFMKKLVGVIVCSSLFQFANAQQTRFLNDPQADYKMAREYYNREAYSLAYPLFKELNHKLRDADRTENALYYQEVRYYTIVCGLRQNEIAAVEQAEEFIDLDDNQSRVELMSYHLGEYYFRQKDYYKALTFYEKTTVEHLSNKEVESLKFHQGYCYFNLQRFAEAKPLFDAVRQVPQSGFYSDANYYYGFISFQEKRYKDALNAFEIAEKSPEYEKVVPYYIATIYYLTGEKEKALNYATERLKKGGGYYDLEMRKLVGHGLFEKGEYAKALPYLQAHAAKAATLSRYEVYELAYSQYQTGKYTESITGFKQLSGTEDSLSQNAMYLLGDAYLKTNQKGNARNAFLFCALNSSNPVQQEISRFNYAKLSYELGYQDVALTEFQQFLQKYPNSSYALEARELLVGAMTNTSNFKDALALLESIKNPSEQARRFYPTILYGRATEMINDGMLVGANDLLDKALKAPYNEKVLPYVQFWKGEIAFRLAKTDEAIQYFSEYLKSGAVNGEVSPANARYNLGYCFLKKDNYRQALQYFDQVARSAKVGMPVFEQDAYLRGGDCYYMLKEYAKASSVYDQVIQYGWSNSDYASYQKALIAGIRSGKEKIKQLQQLQRQYPQSSLIADANMEIANTYLADEDFKSALPYLGNVLKDKQSEALKPEAYLKAGIAYYNLDNNVEALKQYNAILETYPNSPEAEEALENARAIYIEEGRSSEYVNYARKMGKDISVNQQDSLAYAEAEVQLSNGNFTAALQRFDAYLKRFPEGKYVIEANYYQGEIFLSRKDWLAAEKSYSAVADLVPNRFGEKSLLQTARLNFFDIKNYEKASVYYGKLKEYASTEENKLEAMRGLLRSQYQLAMWEAAAANAKDLLQMKGASNDDKVLSSMVLGRSAQFARNYEMAISYYKSVVGLNKGAYAAEARYEIANCQVGQNRLKDAEKSAFEVINKSGSYEMWVTKAYILLGDIYLKQKDYFNAKATFQSVLENAGIPELKEEAQRKLNQVVEEERRQSKVEGN
ncbi:tetratricopeptide repeat protein [Flavihumibacter rivuli]|uniref:tetratricopeptide repeat protein n=1 Tax=Flavihumibacter rivuli TaxID=2838156 RepID=UPI001EFA6E11|nr:tetratricopeptide repeat protein [Flavihumibacter rivuli]ULQ57992.1 tetratricopeptide repeat protein [Flavihumibacter rivuli]